MINTMIPENLPSVTGVPQWRISATCTCRLLGGLCALPSRPMRCLRRKGGVLLDSEPWLQLIKGSGPGPTGGRCGPQGRVLIGEPANGPLCTDRLITGCAGLFPGYAHASHPLSFVPPRLRDTCRHKKSARAILSERESRNTYPK